MKLERRRGKSDKPAAETGKGAATEPAQGAGKSEAATGAGKGAPLPEPKPEAVAGQIQPAETVVIKQGETAGDAIDRHEAEIAAAKEERQAKFERALATLTSFNEDHDGLPGCKTAEEVDALQASVKDTINGRDDLDAEDRAVLLGRWSTMCAERKRALGRGGRRAK